MTVEDIQAAARTDTGKVRERNEDSVAVLRPEDPGLGLLLVVADGMGGHPAGADASRILVEHLGRYPSEASSSEGSDGDRNNVLVALVERLLGEGHAAVLAAGKDDPEKQGLGTTVVAALVLGDRVHVFHCGDSRAYLLRGDDLEQLTGDHVVEEVGIRFLAAHVGMAEGLLLDHTERPLEKGDRLLLCSDGLTDMVPPEVFGLALHQAPDPEAATEALVDLANQGGGVDNVTCVVAFAGTGPRT